MLTAVVHLAVIHLATVRDLGRAAHLASLVVHLVWCAWSCGSSPDERASAFDCSLDPIPHRAAHRFEIHTFGHYRRNLMLSESAF